MTPDQSCDYGADGQTMEHITIVNALCDFSVVGVGHRNDEARSGKCVGFSYFFLHASHK